jgi:hypothetical protein
MQFTWQLSGREEFVWCLAGQWVALYGPQDCTEVHGCGAHVGHKLCACGVCVCVLRHDVCGCDVHPSHEQCACGTCVRHQVCACVSHVVCAYPPGLLLPAPAQQLWVRAPVLPLAHTQLLTGNSVVNIRCGLQTCCCASKLRLAGTWMQYLVCLCLWNSVML